MTTTAPGVTVRQRANQAGASVSVDEGTAFMIGFTERGPGDRAVLCRNLDQVEEGFGEAVTYGLVHASADAFFREGGSRLYIARVTGGSANVATVNIPDGAAANTLVANANGPGAWGADLDVVIADGDTPGTFTVSVVLDGEEVESSPELASGAAAIAWSDNSAFVRFVDHVASAENPAPATYSLAGGSDDNAGADQDDWDTALARFVKDLGPGQVLAPGRTSEAAQQALLAHAEANNRVALIDLSDTGTKGTLVSGAGSLHDESNASFGAAFAPWVTIPGTSTGTTRTVPASAVVAGIIARNDADTNNPNVAAAGTAGVSVSAIDLSQEAWVDEDRADLNDAGVNVIRQRLATGIIQVYGFRSLADPTEDVAFIQFTARREFMSLAARADEALERYVFGEVDGKGLFFSKIEGALRGICLEDYNAGALFGETPDEAFTVTCNTTNNPPEQIAAGEIHAVIAAKVSPFAERVLLEIVKVANTEALA